MLSKFLKASVLIIIFINLSSISEAGTDSSDIKDKLIRYVIPFIGVEDGGGAAFVGAYLPFSMVKLGPDTPLPQNTSGYVPNRPIDGFVHTHDGICTIAKTN